MSNYKISILVPVYNAEKYIEKCACSLFSQTLSEIEYIFVNDGSSDNGIQMLISTLQKYPTRKINVQILEHKQNRGISAARQTAFEYATGTYILAMDSDDYVETDMLERLYNEAESQQADMIFCDYISETSHQSVLRKFPFSTNKNKLMEAAIRGDSALWNKMFRREILLKNNISTLSGIDHGDDLAVLIKLIFHAEKFAYLPIAFYHYVEWNTTSTTKAFKPKYIDDRLQLVDEVVRYLKLGGSTFESEVVLMKALRKSKILLLTNADKRYLNLYPEINSALFSLKVSLYTKIILLLSIPKSSLLVRAYFALLKIVGKKRE